MLNSRSKTLRSALIFTFPILLLGCSISAIAPDRPGVADEIAIFEFPAWFPPGPSPSGELTPGGFSSLNIVKTIGSRIHFRTISDRGPNSDQLAFLEGVGSFVRIFPSPEFTPSIIDFALDLDSGTIEMLRRIPLLTEDHRPFVGLPNRSQPRDKTESMEIAADAFGNRLPVALNGIDPESICRDIDGNFWIGEEYGPDILIFDAHAKFLKRLTPGKGLPAIHATRRANRGFEAIACGTDTVYAMLQSPLPNDHGGTEAFFRITGIDRGKQIVTEEFFDPLLDPALDKVGDIALGPDGRLYVLVQNGKTGANARQVLYSLSLPAFGKNSPGSERSRESPITSKKIELDLSPYLRRFEKIEGLVVTEDAYYFVNDNDFGLTGKVDIKTGVAKRDPAKKSYLIRVPRKASKG